MFPSESRRVLTVALGVALCACGSETAPPAPTGLIADHLNWRLAGPASCDYATEVDQGTLLSGKPTRTLHHLAAAPRSWARAGGELAAGEAGLIGKRVRLTASVKAQEAAGAAGLLLIALDPWGRSLGYDLMDGRRISGTSDFTRYENVLDIPQSTARLQYGLYLSGKGSLWVGGASLEVVPLSVPTTKQDPAPGPTGSEAPVGDFETWGVAGSSICTYETNVDSTVTLDQGPTLHIRSLPVRQPGFTTYMTDRAAAPFHGKRARFSVYVRAREVGGDGGWAGAWMRVDSPTDEMLAFDNMSDRPITGTSDFQRYDVVLDVPQGSANIALGVLLDGVGEIWIGGPTLEVVDSSIPTTGG